MPRYIGGTGNIQPDLMIIGEAPGKHEDETGQPFMGPSGQLLNEFLRKAGITRSQCYITNVVKFRPPQNDLEKLHLIGVDIEQQKQELWENEIKKLNPKCILAIGNLALSATTGYDGILNYRGSILSAIDGATKVVPTVHPAALFSRSWGGNDAHDEEESKGGLDYAYIRLMEFDVARAVEESKFREINLPQRTLQIANNSLELHRFFREYAKCKKASMDIESVNCIPVCIGFAFNRYHAISVPLLHTIGKHRLTDMGDNEILEVWSTVDEQLRRLELVGQNLKYDEFKLTLFGFGDRKFRTMNVVSDTLIKTRVIFPEMPRKKLNDISSVWTREPYYKEEGKEFKFGKSKIEQLLLYNAKDCAVEIEVDEEQEKDLIQLSEAYNVDLVSYYYEYMMKKHKLYLRMENRGFETDFARQKELSVKYKGMADEVHEQLVKLLGRDINVRSNPQVFELLYKEMKFKLMKTAPCSEDTIVALLGNHAKKAEQKEILTVLLEERRIRNQKSKGIDFTPDYDGTYKTVYNISATETCRSSTSILKKPVRPKKIGGSFHTIPAHGRLAKDVKSMLRPRKGKVFIKADASQAEARCVAVLSEDWELLKAFDSVDIHRRTAGMLLGLTTKLELSPDFKDAYIDNMLKDGAERFCGKKTRHAGNYNMGKRRLMMEFNTDAQKFEINTSISEWKAGQMLDLFHKASPNIRSVFHRDVIEAISSTRCLIDPFGGVRLFNGRMGDELFKEGFANIPQRTVGHLVQGAAVEIEDELNGDEAGYFIGEKHDELIMEVPEDNYMPYANLLRSKMTKPIDFSLHCTLKRNYILTIPCDVEISDTHYGDFRKAKL